MKTQPRQHIANKYNTCTVVTSPVYIGSKLPISSKISVGWILPYTDQIVPTIVAAILER